MDPRHALGLYGESAAERWLSQRGLRVIARRFWTRFGEIDLIALDGKTWVFVEVKTRQRRQSFSALDALTPAKQKRFFRAAFCYIGYRRLAGQPFRFDVLTL